MTFEVEFTTDIREPWKDQSLPMTRRWRGVAEVDEAMIRRLMQVWWEEIER
ncbi:hypothetical protein [Thiocapsa marina]|uniref:Uncharacterized protein n=1 Tax=Thiocapsa marina 5811 TaxID=768671 RepID=F9U9J6_9GAMM|nr:hypothetical protein [Thiocapsa marina]EGV15881.1 hypothetical protein ThimaDRAFT_4827 [Thiocapsa marina 5811]EGV18794.1 hypothetical protein ThimaDRAFT_1598 [Thiocapsa marina 5811]